MVVICSSTVANLQTRVETLTTTNALMKEDLAISKNTILALQDENRQLKQKLERQKLESSTNGGMDQQDTSSQRHYCSSDTEVDAAQQAVESDNISNLGASSSNGLSVQDLSKKLHEERSQKEQLEADLEVARHKKEEMELAMKLMEKDVHEKQDTIISLRSQLDDIKMINLEMYRKLQVNYQEFL